MTTLLNTPIPRHGGELLLPGGFGCRGESRVEEAGQPHRAVGEVGDCEFLHFVEFTSDGVEILLLFLWW